MDKMIDILEGLKKGKNKKDESKFNMLSLINYLKSYMMAKFKMNDAKVIEIRVEDNYFKVTLTASDKFDETVVLQKAVAKKYGLKEELVKVTNSDNNIVIEYTGDVKESFEDDGYSFEENDDEDTDEFSLGKVVEDIKDTLRGYKCTGVSITSQGKKEEFRVDINANITRNFVGTITKKISESLVDTFSLKKDKLKIGVSYKGNTQTNIIVEYVE